jgi:hypothetical protein
VIRTVHSCNYIIIIIIIDDDTAFSTRRMAARMQRCCARGQLDMCMQGTTALLFVVQRPYGMGIGHPYWKFGNSIDQNPAFYGWSLFAGVTGGHECSVKAALVLFPQTKQPQCTAKMSKSPAPVRRCADTQCMSGILPSRVAAAANVQQHGNGDGALMRV